MSIENKDTLAGVRAELAAGTVRIGDKVALLNELVMSGGAAGQVRIDLWNMELKQAGLTRRHTAMLKHIARAQAALKVLIVEDEFLVMMMISDHLSGAGYDVVEAANAELAVDELEGDDSIGAIFTDVQLPGSMNGLQLALLVHLRWPLVRVLITSGSDRYGPADMSQGDTFFRKPYLPEDIALALRAA